MEKCWGNFVLWHAITIRRVIIYLLIFSVVSSVFLLHLVTPAYGIPKQSPEEFIETYDPERDYQPATEPIITPLPGFGGNVGGGGSGGTGVSGSAGGYYLPNGQWVGEGNVQEIKKFNLEEFEREEAVKAGKPVPTAKPKGVQKVAADAGNWLGNTWNSVVKATGNAWNSVTKAVGSAARFMQEKLVKPAVSEAKKVTQSLVGGVKFVAQSVVNMVKNTLVNTVQVINENIISIAENFSKQITTTISSAISSLGNSIINATSAKGFIKSDLAELKRQKLMNQINEKYDVNISDGWTAKWDIEELKWINQILEKMPEHLYKDAKLNEINREKFHLLAPQACGVHNGISGNITITDGALDCIGDTKILSENEFDNSKNSLQVTFVHEITHAYVENKPHLVEKYVNIAWNSKEVEYKLGDKTFFTANEYVSKTKNEFVSGYSEGNTKVKYIFFTSSEKIGQPEEDLAETLGYYVVFPNKVEENTPVKNKFIESYIISN